MARKLATDSTELQEESFSNVVASYLDIKSKADYYKKQCDEQNAYIKAYMQEHSLTECESELGTVKLIVQHKESMNAEKLLGVVKQFNIPAIKTIEVVDATMLEDYLYKHADNVSADVMKKLSDCRTSTEVIQLRVSK